MAANSDAAQRLSVEDLNHAFDVQYHLKNLSHTFEKLGIQ
jgi:hypothetical protein